jgi:hypothetical protein
MCIAIQILIMKTLILEEFADEIEGWVLDALKEIGCDTAKSVLQIGKEDLVKRTDLEEETIDDVLASASRGVRRLSRHGDGRGIPIQGRNKSSIELK